MTPGDPPAGLWVPRIPLAEVPIAEFRCLKSLRVVRDGVDHSRWVFLSAPNTPEPLVWKLWNPGYVRRETILTGFATGLYTPDIVPGLVALVVHRGLCRGYAMRPGTRLAAPPAGLVRTLWRSTRASGHFALQYRRSHVLETAAGPSLIDLETVYPLDALPGLRARGIDAEDAEYGRLLDALRAGDPGGAAVDAMAEAHLATLARPRVAGPGDARDMLGRKARGLRRRAERLGHRLLGDGREEIVVD